MAEQSCVPVQSLLIDKLELHDSVVQALLKAAEAQAVADSERSLHVQAVEPHLVRITLLVPESAGGGPWLCFKLLHEHINSCLVFLLAGQIVDAEHDVAHPDLIHAVCFKIICADNSVLWNVVIQHVLDEPEDPFISKHLVCAIEGLKENCRLIAVCGVLRVVFPDGGQTHSLCPSLSCVYHSNPESVVQKKGPQLATAAPRDCQILYP